MMPMTLIVEMRQYVNEIPIHCHRQGAASLVSDRQA